MVNINTNNGVERQNETVKYTYLKKHCGSSSTRMLSIFNKILIKVVLERCQQILTSQYKMYHGEFVQISHTGRSYHWVVVISTVPKMK